ncbi:MAG: S41 family peptidase [Bacteroidales bacterium]
MKKGIIKYIKESSIISRSVMVTALMTALMLSCEKVLMKPDASDDPVTIFEEIWTFTEKHYSFFEYKGIDWHNIYSRYRPLVRNNMNSVELFDLCAAMLYELRDGHVNLVSSFDRSRYWEWYLDSPDNFSYSLIERNYFKGRQRYIGPLHFLDMGDITYIYYGSFANTISDNNLDIIVSGLEKKKGLIIDVRSNGGGSTVNAKKLTSRFTDKKVFVGYNHVKNGPGYNDFRIEEIHIEPHDGERFTGDIVVLTNRRSYSATTYFSQYMNALDNVTFVGDTTGGGGGMPAFHDLPNGWLLRVSSSRFYSPRGKNIESGIPPHIQVDMTEESMAEGRDDILEKAIEILKAGTSN